GVDRGQRDREHHDRVPLGGPGQRVGQRGRGVEAVRPGRRDVLVRGGRAPDLPVRLRRGTQHRTTDQAESDHTYVAHSAPVCPIPRTSCPSAVLLDLARTAVSSYRCVMTAAVTEGTP